MIWFVYIILCTDNTLYTGITLNVSRRFKQHETGQGAKYFRGRQPKQLVYLEPGHNRSSATKREINLKKLSRLEKAKLIESDSNKLAEFLATNTQDKNKHLSL
ncbi:MAG: GIY-YIG nuclease family protein [Methylococcaceae bacterium]